MNSKPSTKDGLERGSPLASFRSHTSMTSRDEEVDWKSLEDKYSELKGYLSAPTLSFSNSVEERKKQRENIEKGLEAIIEVALSESKMLFQDGEYGQAYMGALKTLQFVQELYGPSSIEQMEVYFLLSKVSQALKKLKQAEEFLSVAHWTMIKNPNTSSQIRAELHQNFGLLYVHKGLIKKAIEHLATSVYFLSLIHGTKHLITSFGYFNLGNVFASQGKVEIAIDFLKNVTSIWYDNLYLALENDKPESSTYLKSSTRSSLHSRGRLHTGRSTPGFDSTQRRKKLSSGSVVLEIEKIDEEKIHEAGRMIEQILNIIIERFTENSMETGKIFQVLGLYQWYIGETVKAKECLEKASSIIKYALGDTHKESIFVQNLLKKVSK